MLSSPMLRGSFGVRRRSAQVGENGRVKHADLVFNNVGGIVYATGNNSNTRDIDASTGDKTIEVLTQFRLQSQAKGLIPDVVLWRGDEYLVETDEDYTPYGRGWIQATCRSQRVVDAQIGQGS